MIGAMEEVEVAVTATGISITNVSAETAKDKLASLRKCIEICDV
jgi:hypothetical protein